MAVLLVIILAAIPLLITPNLQLFYDVTPKAAVLLVGAALSCVFVMLGKIEFTNVTSHRYRRWMLWLLALSGICAVISTAVSERPHLSLTGTHWREFGLPERLAILCLSAVVLSWLSGRPERTTLLTRAAIISGLAAAAYGILQYFGHDPWLPHMGYEAGEGAARIVRPPSTLGHANYFAAWLVFPVFWGLDSLFSSQPRAWRAMGAVCAIIGSAAIVLSGSRAAAFGLAAGFALVIALKRSKASAAVLLIVAVALSIFYISPPGEMLRRRVQWVKEDPLGGARLWLWKDSLRMASHKPLTGFGLETYSSAFPRYQSAELSRAYPAFYHESPHNALLDILTEEGLPGLAAFAVLALLALTAAKRESALLGISLISFLLCQQFNAWTIPTALYCYVTIAILVAQYRPKLTSASRALRWPWRLMFAAAAIVFLAAGIRTWTAGIMLERTRALLTAGKADEAAAQYKRSMAWGGTADLWYSRSMAAARQWPEAFEAARRATATAEDSPNAWYNLAAFEASRNDPAATEHSLREAIRAAPNWFKPHWMLARFLLATGRSAEARKEAETAAFLNAGKDDEVRQTLAQFN